MTHKGRILKLARLWTLLLLSGLALLWAVHRGVEPPQVGDHALEVIREWSGTYSNSHSFGPSVIRTRHKWVDTWNTTLNNYISPPPPPNVDFDKYMVIAWFAGRNIGPHRDVLPFLIRMDGDTLVIHVTTRETATSLQEATNPFRFAVVPSFKDVVWHDNGGVKKE